MVRPRPLKSPTCGRTQSPTHFCPRRAASTTGSPFAQPPPGLLRSALCLCPFPSSQGKHKASPIRLVSAYRYPPARRILASSQKINNRRIIQLCPYPVHTKGICRVIGQILWRYDTFIRARKGCLSHLCQNLGIFQRGPAYRNFC